MEEKIKIEISNEIFRKIGELEIERSQEKQKILAQELIKELDIEDFTPYIAYNEAGDIFISLNYYYSSYGIEESLLSGNHDVVIQSTGIYVEDITSLLDFKNQYFEEIKFQREEKEEEKIKTYRNEKELEKVSEDLESFNNQLMNLVNFERPKCVGNYSKITEIDEEISLFEKKIEELNNDSESINKSKKVRRDR
jgi:hypothetical protein